MDNHGMPPSAVEFEESILAAIFIDPQNASEILEDLEPHHFYKTAHAKIFGLAAGLYQQGINPDLAAVHQEARERDMVEAVGGASYLARMIDCPLPSNADHYIAKIKEKYALRKAIEICNAITKRCFKDQGDAFDTIDKFQQEIFELGAGMTVENIESMGSMIKRSFDDYETLYGSAQAVTGIPTGFADYDRLLSGLQPTDLIILAARPSMGKTSLAIQMARNAAKQGIPTLVYSLEMSKRQLRDKIVAEVTGIDTTKFRQGGFTSEERKKIEGAQDALYSYPLYIDDTAALHWREIRRRSRKYKAKYGIELIIIDHLQLVDHDKRDNRNVELGTITAGFKATAKDLDIPVLVLSQLNRNLEQRSDKRPMLSDLRESGNIEQDADVVSFLYRPDYYGIECDFLGQTELITAKHRNGPTGLTTLLFQEKTASFQSMVHRVPDYE
jgi:replicative DNA helicase